MLGQRNLFILAGCIALFHLANASLLPMVAQSLGRGNAAHGPLVMAGLLAVPQVVVALLAPWIGYWSELWGRKPLLIAAFAIETARALLFMLTSDPNLMMAVQVLDGLTGAVINVVMILIVTDLTAGSGEKPVRVYDPSGPYTDPALVTDIRRGLPALRRPWILARGDVEEYGGRTGRPEDNGLKPGEMSAVPVSAHSVCTSAKI